MSLMILMTDCALSRWTARGHVAVAALATLAIAGCNGLPGSFDGAGADAGRVTDAAQVTDAAPVTGCRVDLTEPIDVQAPATCDVQPAFLGDGLELRVKVNTGGGLLAIYVLAKENVLTVAPGPDFSGYLDAPNGVICDWWNGTVMESTTPNSKNFMLDLKCGDGKSSIAMLGEVGLTP